MKISVNSGFQRGGSVLQWDGEKFVQLRRAAENTYQGDGDSSFEIEVPDNFRGAVVRFWGISSLSYANQAELIGFGESELSAPSPVMGFVWDSGTMCRVSEPCRVVSFRDYLDSLARGMDITPDAELIAKGEIHPSGNGAVLVHLGASLGDQRADAWAIYRNGQLENWVCGGGDSTPEPVKTATGWDFTNPRSETAKAWQEEDARFAAAKDLGEADAAVVAHIRASYAAGCNPLPTLRRKHGGQWTWEKSLTYPTSEQAEVGLRLFTQFSTPDSTIGYGWVVKHIPTNK